MAPPKKKASKSAKAQRKPRPIVRGKKAAINVPNRIFFLELQYPGTGGYTDIKNKRVYAVLWNSGGDPALADEIYIDGNKNWWRFKPNSRCKRHNPVAKHASLLPQAGYPITKANCSGVLYFFLSSMPLGAEAADQLVKWIKDEEKQPGKGIEKEFKKAMDFASTPLVADPRLILWQDTNRRTKPGQAPHTAGRCAVNFDDKGKRTGKFDPSKPGYWKHTVVLQDPRAWLEDLSHHGIRPAIQAYRTYRFDRTRQHARFVAASVAGEIKHNRASKWLDQAVMGAMAPAGTSDRGQLEKRAALLLKRLNWDRHVRRMFRSTGRRVHHATALMMSMRLIRHKLRKKGKDPFLESQYPGTPEQWLAIDTLYELALRETAQRFVRQMARYILGRRHRVLTCEHFHAAIAAHAGRGKTKATAPASGQAAAGKNAVDGMVHWAIVLDLLNEVPEGRKVIEALTKAGISASGPDDAHFFSMPRALTYGALNGQAPKAAKALDFMTSTQFFVAQTAAQSAQKLADVYLGGLLDKSFTQAAKGPSRIARFVDAWFSRMLTASQKTAAASTMQSRLTKWEQLSSQAATPAAGRRVGRPPKALDDAWDAIFKDLDTQSKAMVQAAARSGRYERAAIQARAELAADRSIQPLKWAPAALVVLDAIARLQVTVERLTSGGSLGANDFRAAVAVGEAAVGSLEMTARAVHASRYGRRVGRVNWATTVARGRSVAMSTLGKVLGVAAAALDMYLSLDAMTKARSGYAMAGELCAAAGAGAALVGGVHALVAGSLGGPFGWAIVLICIGLSVAAYILKRLAGDTVWQHFIRGSFIGKNSHKRSNVRWEFTYILKLYQLFRAEIDDQGRVTIYPQLMYRKDKFVVMLQGTRPNITGDDLLGAATIALGRKGFGTKFEPTNLAKNTTFISDGAAPRIKRFSFWLNLDMSGDRSRFVALHADIQLWSGQVKGQTVPGNPLRLTLARGPSGAFAGSAKGDADPQK